MHTVVNIGKSIRIEGELTGDEDLTIEGTVEGKINLQGHTLKIGSNGHIKADVEAKEVIVAGELVGNVTADSRVEIASSGSMDGDIKSPRLILADGGSFKGGVDMSPKEVSGGGKKKAFVAHDGAEDGGNGKSAKILPKSKSGTLDVGPEN